MRQTCTYTCYVIVFVIHCQLYYTLTVWLVVLKEFQPAAEVPYAQLHFEHPFFFWVPSHLTTMYPFSSEGIAVMLMFL